MKLFLSALTKFLLGGLLLALLLFLPAGTVHYPRAWLFLGVLLIPMFIAGLVMLVKNPDLLRSRLEARETQGEQQLVIRLSGAMFVVGFVAAGLGFRLGWPAFSPLISTAGVYIFLVSYILYAEVLRENTFLSRTIRVQENQTVVDTGLYSLVRHPMYAVTLVLFLSIPLILGSPLCLLCFLGYPAILVKRIRNEEEVLKRELKGYDAYMERVRWRLLPHIW